MTGDDFALLFVTIFPEMLPISKVIGFIHSNVEVFRSKASPDIGDQTFYEIVYLRLIHIEDIVDIKQFLEAAKFRWIREMRQGLDTGNKFYSFGSAITVQFLDFLLGIGPAKISKIGLPIDFINIFAIKF